MLTEQMPESLEIHVPEAIAEAPVMEPTINAEEAPLQSELLDLLADYQMEQESRGEDGEELTEAQQYEMLVVQVLTEMRAHVAAREPIAFLLINPALEAGFQEAWQALDESIISQDFKTTLPIRASEQTATVQVVTAQDIEIEHLIRIFGPREQGGNGLLPAIEQYMSMQPVAIRLTPEILRTLYFLRVADMVMPKVQTASINQMPAHQTPSGLIVPRR